MAKSKTYRPSLVRIRGWVMKEEKKKKVSHICVCGNPTYTPFCVNCGLTNAVLQQETKEKVRS